MCIGDWRLGRLVRSSAQAFDIATGVGLTLKPSQQRVGIWFSTDETPIASLVAWKLLFTNGSILSGMYPTGHVLVTLENSGDLCTKGVTVSSQDGNFKGTFTEFFMPEKYLTAALEEFERKVGIKG